ncbi:MAG: NAD(P)-dependent oxidoreductase [Betaproteobacteria bacterium]
MTVDVVCLRPEADFTRVGVRATSQLRVAYRGPSDADVPDLLTQARALVIPAVGPKLAPALFESAPLELVQVTGAGVDRLDQVALTRRNIPVANVAGGSNAAVAEYAVATATFLLRRFGWSDAQIRQGRYAESRAKLVAENVGGLEGLLVGIVGMGTIGRAVARAFAQAGCRIAYHDPMPVDAKALGGLEARSLALHALLAESDVVSLHVPLLPETRNLVGERELDAMKPGAILIQASRGGIVDEAALASRLASGHIGGAAVDVYAHEPPEPGNPLLALQGESAARVLFTPHIAGVTRQSAAFLFRAAWENVERVLLRGEAPLHRVY